MMESGEYLDTRYQNGVRYKKPVGIYWLQTATVTIARALGVRNALTTISVYRILSLIGAIGSVLVAYWAYRSMVAR